jgi:four helix bundle protein
VRTYFDHETLDVYQLELQFIKWMTPLLANVKQQRTGVRMAEVLDQLDRASLSALLNTAEGNGRRQRRTRAKFFDDARGSASECAACLDALVAKGICTAQEIDNGKQLLLRITSILTKLIRASIFRCHHRDEQVFEDEEEDEKND